jgi:intein-encoded DNA endonuclease-like protein
MQFIELLHGKYRGKMSMDETTKAYIAGFLDGDGSIMFQLVERKDYVYGYQIRASVCFYQDTNHKGGLYKIKEKIGVGYIRDRNDGVSDYTIVGYANVEKILELVEPYVVFKLKHVKEALMLLKLLQENPKPTVKEFLDLAEKVDSFAALNYSKKKVNNAAKLRDFLISKGLLVPVTTESVSLR